MLYFFSNHVLYIFFLSGTCLIFLSYQAFRINEYIKNNEILKFPWHFLAYYSFLYGIYEWLQLITLGFGDSLIFYIARLVIASMSYVFLLEFSRQSLIHITGKGPSRWIYIPLFLLALSGLFKDIHSLNAAINYSIGLPAGIFCAVVFFLLAKNKNCGKTSSLISIGTAIVFHTIATNVIIPFAQIFPANIINTQTVFTAVFNTLNLPLELIGYIEPIQIVRMIINFWLLFAFSFWMISLISLNEDRPFEIEINKTKRQYHIGTIITTSFILILGWIATEAFLKYDQNWTEKFLLTRTKTASACIDPKKVQKLDGSVDDYQKPEYWEIQNQIDSIMKSNYDCGSIYLLAIRRGIIVELADSSVYSDETFKFPPGFPFRILTELKTLSCDGVSFVVGPIASQLGFWVTGTSVIRDPETGIIVSVLCMDTDANQWIRLYSFHTTLFLLITFMSCVLCITIYRNNFKNKENAAIIKASERLYKSLVEGSPNSIKLLDRQGRIVTINQTGITALGLDNKSIIGKHFPEVWPESVRPTVEQAIRDTLNGQMSSFEAKYIRFDGVKQTWYVVLNPIRETDGSIKQFVVISADITDRKIAEEKVLHNSLHDSLTGLANRSFLMEKLNASQKCSDADPNYIYSILFLDFDRFKFINDTFGHQIGDQLLISISQMLNNLFSDNESLARLGGDEFVILLNNIKRRDNAIDRANSILKILSSPFNIQGNILFPSVSIGIAFNSPECKTSEEVLKNADTAMYRAKALGKGRYEIFDNSMLAEKKHELEIEAQLHHVIQNNELLLNFQPVISLNSGKITGLEAFVCWNHPVKGFLYPNDFLPVARESGLIIKIGEWIMRNAFSQAKSWYDMGFKDLRIILNLSEKEFHHPELIPVLKNLISKTLIDPKLIEIEITEEMILKDIYYNKKIIDEISSLGPVISIGDFGTSLLLLGDLKHLPVKYVKIHRTFIKNEKTYKDFIRSLISFAHSFNLKIIGVGVENKNQLSFLKEEGCDEMQGYYFSQPVTPAIITEFLKNDTRFEIKNNVNWKENEKN